MNYLHAQESEVIPSLDGFRAVSVLIVVFAHSGLEKVVPGGLGVTIFFFLSGYLISTLMLDESQSSRGINISKFYVRRVFRLMPPLLVTLTLAYGSTFAGLLPGGISLQGLAAQLFYFANYYALFFDPGNSIPAGTGILWSLAVEEHFYIFYPLFMALMLGRAARLQSIAILLGLACLAVLAWRIHLVNLPSFMPQRTYLASDTRIDSIIYGCILAIVKNPAREIRRQSSMSTVQWVLFSAAIGALLLTLLYRNPVFRETVRYSIQGLALMPIFYFAVRFSNNELFRYLNSPFIMTLGVYSYAIYLIHFVVISIIKTNFPSIATKWYVVLVAALIISTVYAAAIDRFVDGYFRQIRRRFRSDEPSRTAVLKDCK
jgi:peptidoglycan/LPS O-acetylase OafA/YrhL